MIDQDGFRANVGIILVNPEGRLFWAKRIGQNAWQFPQGGIQEQESPLDAMYRELTEEVGLDAKDVEVIATTQGWLRYRLPKRFIRPHSLPLCIGQKQKWFLLRLTTNDDKVHLDTGDSAEFESWRWVDYWYPIEAVVPFKQSVYRRALKEFAPLVNFK